MRRASPSEAQALFLVTNRLPAKIFSEPSLRPLWLTDLTGPVCQWPSRPFPTVKQGCYHLKACVPLPPRSPANHGARPRWGQDQARRCSVKTKQRVAVNIEVVVVTKQGHARCLRQTAEHAAMQAQEDRKAMFLPPHGSKRSGKRQRALSELGSSTISSLSPVRFGSSTSPGQCPASCQRPGF